MAAPRRARRLAPTTWLVVVGLVVILSWLGYMVVTAYNRGDLPCRQPNTPGHCGYPG